MYVLYECTSHHPFYLLLRVTGKQTVFGHFFFSSSHIRIQTRVIRDSASLASLSSKLVHIIIVLVAPRLKMRRYKIQKYYFYMTLVSNAFSCAAAVQLRLELT